MRKQLSLACLMAALLSAGVHAQENEPASIRTSVREVVVDVVVHDKHGKLVRKLDPREITLLEDGVPQKVRSLRLLAGSEARLKDVAAAAPGRRSPVRTVNIVCMVFQDLSPDTRKPALDAAQEFLKNELRPNTFIGVFTLNDTGVRPLVAFTNKQAVLAEAIRRAAAGQIATLSNSAQAVFSALALDRELTYTPPPPPPQAGSVAAVPSTPPGPGVSPATGAFLDASVATGSDASDAANNPLQRQGIHNQRVVAVRELQAFRWLISQLAAVPFRKTVLLFSPGIDRPASERDYWQKMIADANQSNISFYIADLTGSAGRAPLSTVAREAQNRSAGLSKAQTAPAASGGDLMNRSQEFDVSEYATAEANVHTTQVELAETTGGFVFTDLGSRMLKRIMDDVETHYELTYGPTSDSYDGRYHKITVQVNRADLHVEARPGYFAVPADSDDSRTLAGLRALNTTPLPRAFEYRAEALQFFRPDGKNEAAIVFDLPLRGLALTPESDVQKHRAHPSFLALIKDSTGRVVEQFSADSREEIADAQLGATAAGRLQYARRVALDAGRYTLETAVVDWENGKTSAGVSQFECAVRDGPGISSIALVRRSEDAPNADAADPLIHEGKRIVPSLFNGLETGETPSIFFRVYPDRSNSSPPRLRAQFLVDGRLLADQTTALPAPDASGSIPVLIQAPGRPGANELKLTVLQGGDFSSGEIKYSIPVK